MLPHYEDRIGFWLTLSHASYPLLYRYLERKLGNKYTVTQIVSTLQEMDFVKHEGKGYQPVYTRTELTDALHEAFGFCTSKQIVPTKK